MDTSIHGFDVVTEVQYTGPDGNVHSDLSLDKEMLHAALDEWLEKSKGTGFFYIGDYKDLKDNFSD